MSRNASASVVAGHAPSWASQIRSGLLAGAAGICGWSADLLRDAPRLRVYGVLGLFCSAATALAAALGPALDPHLLFGLVIIQQCLWYVAIGVLLVQARR
jgi:hypothetical protein